MKVNLNVKFYKVCKTQSLFYKLQMSAMTQMLSKLISRTRISLDIDIINIINFDFMGCKPIIRFVQGARLAVNSVADLG